MERTICVVVLLGAMVVGSLVGCVTPTVPSSTPAYVIVSTFTDQQGREWVVYENGDGRQYTASRQQWNRAQQYRTQHEAQQQREQEAARAAASEPLSWWRRALVGASDAVVHAPRQASKSYQMTINGHPFYCHDNGVTTNCQEM